MRRYCLLLTVHCLLAAGTAAAAPALLRWQTDVARPQPRDWEVFQGETVVLAPVMTEGGAGVDLSGSTCALWYQTNGMAGAWWSVPAATGTVAGEVRATWSPTNDCGAARYNYFVAAASPAGTMYRAHGRLVMRHAPGAAPAILAAPTTLTDAMQAWADSRYDPAGAAQTVSNALAAAVQAEAAARASVDAALTNGAALGAAALQPAWAATGTVWAAERLGGTGSWTTVENGTNWLYTVTATNALSDDTSRLIVATVEGDMGDPEGPGRMAETGDVWIWDGASSRYISAESSWGMETGGPTVWGVRDANSRVSSQQTAPTNLFTSTAWTISFIYGTLTNSVPVTNRVQITTEPTVTILTQDAVDTHNTNTTAHPYIRAAIDAATNALAGNIMGGDLPVQRWQMFDFGVSSNRWLILTNDVLEIWEQ